MRFDEAGADGVLRPSGYLRYAQDVAWQHSEAEGYDRAWYAARRSHWLVRSVSLRLRDRVAYGTQLEVSTEVTGWRRVLARRHTRFIDEDASSAPSWTRTGRCSDRPDGPPACRRPSSSASRRVRPSRPCGCPCRPPPVDATTVPMTVRDADVDPMGHLNNAAYVDLIEAGMAAMTEGDAARTTMRPPRTYRLVYLRPAPARSDLAVIVLAARRGPRRVRDRIGWSRAVPRGGVDARRGVGCPGGRTAVRAQGPARVTEDRRCARHGSHSACCSGS